MLLKSLLVSTRAALSILAASLLRPSLWTASTRSLVARPVPRRPGASSTLLRTYLDNTLLSAREAAMAAIPRGFGPPDVFFGDICSAHRAGFQYDLDLIPGFSVCRAAAHFRTVVIARIVVNYPQVSPLASLYRLHLDDIPWPRGMPLNTPDVVRQLLESDAAIHWAQGPEGLLSAFVDEGEDDDEVVTASKKYIVDYLDEFYKAYSLPFGARLPVMLNLSKESTFLAPR
eukprot:m.334914 g.334914  ORF g.334914 m.334914 type:complete len:230 (+) comp55675_c0_seq4:765-1454(+)